MSVLHGSFFGIVHIFKLNILIYSPFPTQLCDLTDCRLPGCSVHRIFQARILEWVAISSPGDLPNPGIEPLLPHLHCRWIFYQDFGENLKLSKSLTESWGFSSFKPLLALPSPQPLLHLLCFKISSCLPRLLI